MHEVRYGAYSDVTSGATDDSLEDARSDSSRDLRGSLRRLGSAGLGLLTSIKAENILEPLHLRLRSAIEILSVLGLTAATRSSYISRCGGVRA